jgi:hypothetical protein
MKNPTYTVECSNGRRFDETTTPPGIRPSIESALQRGRTSGCCSGAGMLWRWCKTPFDAEKINIEITSRGQVVETHQVPKLVGLPLVSLPRGLHEFFVSRGTIEAIESAGAFCSGKRGAAGFVRRGSQPP